MMQENQINLLPWRRMKRFRAKKQRIIYGVIGVITLSVMVGFVYYYVTQVTQQQVLLRSRNRTVDRVAYVKERQEFNEQLKKTSAKAGQQSLDSLHFIGLLKDKSKTWALISQSDGMVCTVMPGDYLGKEHGLVLRIREDAIDIEKTAWGKRGVEKKRIVLRMRKMSGERVV